MDRCSAEEVCGAVVCNDEIGSWRSWGNHLGNSVAPGSGLSGSIDHFDKVKFPIQSLPGAKLSRAIILHPSSQRSRAAT